jgi:hypothetical protein
MLVEETPEECRVEISLSLAGEPIRVTASCRAVEREKLQAMATATLKAVQQAVEDSFTCRLADLDHVHALGKNLIAVLVDINFEGKDVQVFGSCQITETELVAAAKAALNATNRFVELSVRD